MNLKSRIIKIFRGNVQEVKFASKQIIIILLVIINGDKNLIHIIVEQVSPKSLCCGAP